MNRLALIALGAFPALLAPRVADARVALVNERGFVVQLAAEVTADAPTAWRELLTPRDWWNGEHTFSNDAANLTLDPRPGGCFCETLPAKDGGDAPRGGVEHMRVVYLEAPRALRLRGALGPLQAEAVTGTLTVELRPSDGGGTRILWEYVVGGFMRPTTDAVAASVDQVLAEQLAGLAAKLGAKAPPPSDAASAADKKDEIIGR